VHVTTLPNQPADSCPNCGQAAIGAYCSHCGEKRRDRAEWRLSNIASEMFAEFTNLEHSKLWQTFRLLLFKPGQLTRDYWNGRRKRYLGPVKLYFIFFALSLVLYSVHRPTAVYDIRTLAAADSAGGIPRILEALAEQRGMPVEQVAQELNSRWQSYISLSQVVYPLFVALALMLLLRRRRLYFAEHLIFALHILAFLYLSFAIFWPAFLLFGIQASMNQYTPAYLAISAASIIWMAVYLLLALRRAYGEGWVAAAIKSILVFITYMVTSMAFMSATLALAIAITRRAG
jgi:hypothetical protein